MHRIGNWKGEREGVNVNNVNGRVEDVEREERNREREKRGDSLVLCVECMMYVVKGVREREKERKREKTPTDAGMKATTNNNDIVLDWNRMFFTRKILVYVKYFIRFCLFIKMF